MSESLILFTVIGTAILSPILNYLVNSKCRYIKCFHGCVEIERVVENDSRIKEDDENNENNENKENK